MRRPRIKDTKVQTLQGAPGAPRLSLIETCMSYHSCPILTTEDMYVRTHTCPDVQLFLFGEKLRDLRGLCLSSILRVQANANWLYARETQFNPTPARQNQERRTTAENRIEESDLGATLSILTIRLHWSTMRTRLHDILPGESRLSMGVQPYSYGANCCSR